MNAVLTISEDKLEIPRAEILRYLGCGGASPGETAEALLAECMTDFAASADYRACYTVCDVESDADAVRLGALEIDSSSLIKCLAGCEKAIVFAATVGLEADRRRAACAVQSPARAAMLDSIGTAAIEAWCDELCYRWSWEYGAAGYRLRPRFSPGYGDLPLAMQPQLLDMLDSWRKAGISMTSSLMMLPQKSVTAIIGLYKTDSADKGGV